MFLFTARTRATVQMVLQDQTVKRTGMNVGPILAIMEENVLIWLLPTTVPALKDSLVRIINHKYPTVLA
jgi:hypothetical protein